MKILHVITTTDAGGAEAQLLRLAAGGGADHGVVCLAGPGRLAPAMNRAGARVTCLGLKPGPGALARGLPRLAALMRAQRPDLVQTWLYHADLLGLLAARLSGAAPLIWTLRCADMDLERYSRGVRLVLKANTLLSKLPAAIAANSQAGLEWHRRLGYPAERMRVIPNGFDLERFRPDPAARARLRAELGLGEGDLLVGCAARLDPMKDHACLLAAARLAAAQRPEMHFVLLGQGVSPGQPELAGWSEPPLAGRSHLLGYREDVPAWLAAMDVHVSSSVSEGLCNAVGEAMAVGLPNLVTDVGDSRALVGPTGLTVPRSRPQELARALIELAGMAPAERTALGRQARRRIRERYSLDGMRAAYLALYRELTAPRSR